VVRLCLGSIACFYMHLVAFVVLSGRFEGFYGFQVVVFGGVILVWVSMEGSLLGGAIDRRILGKDARVLPQHVFCGSCSVFVPVVKMINIESMNYVFYFTQAGGAGTPPFAVWFSDDFDSPPPI
jgi:hypothetical protein